LAEKITLMEAYLIEHVRQAGITDQEIEEKVKALQADDFQEIDESFDFTLLHTIKNRIGKVLADGYEVKYLTFKGLINLLRLKFQKEEKKDYEVDDFILYNLDVTEEELQEIQQMVSQNWNVTKEEHGIKIEPRHSL